MFSAPEASADCSRAFFLAASLQDQEALARYAGAVWVFILALIVALPTITPILKKRLGDK